MKYETIVNQPVIVAERFDLRPLRVSDAGLIGMNAGDVRVARYTRSIPHPLPPGATEALIARAQADGRSTDDLCLGVSGQCRLGPGLDELRVSVSWGCRGIQRCTRCQGSDLDL